MAKGKKKEEPVELPEVSGEPADAQPEIAALIATPSPVFKGERHGVKFKGGLAAVESAEIAERLVKDHRYEDVTDGVQSNRLKKWGESDLKRIEQVREKLGLGGPVSPPDEPEAH